MDVVKVTKEDAIKLLDELCLQLEEREEWQTLTRVAAVRRIIDEIFKNRE